MASWEIPCRCRFQCENYGKLPRNGGFSIAMFDYWRVKPLWMVWDPHRSAIWRPPASQRLAAQWLLADGGTSSSSSWAMENSWSGPFQWGMEKNMIVEASTNHNKSHRHRLQHDWGSHRAQLLNMVLGRRWRSCLNRRFRCADAQNCGFRISVWTTGQLVNFCWSNVSHVNPTRSATEIRPSVRKGQVGSSNSSSSSLTNLLNHLHV